LLPRSHSVQRLPTQTARISASRKSGELAAWDTSIMPDGPACLRQRHRCPGAPIYATKCASCHGENGKGAISSALVARGPITSINAAEKTIANFWPYATTLFDYIRRAMPWQQPKTLTSDDVYRADRLHSCAQPAHRRERGDERDDAAESADAEP